MCLPSRESHDVLRTIPNGQRGQLDDRPKIQTLGMEFADYLASVRAFADAEERQLDALDRRSPDSTLRTTWTKLDLPLLIECLRRNRAP